MSPLLPPSGVVGEAEQLDRSRLAVVVVLALLVVAGVGQQGSLGVPGDGEGGGVALHLPQLLPCRAEEGGALSDSGVGGSFLPVGSLTCFHLGDVDEVILRR